MTLVSFLPSISFAASNNISYPISELGGCKNQAECRAFCDKLENRQGVCFEYAKKNNLITQEEIQTAEKFAKAASSNDGPKFCKQSSGCNIAKYCDDTNHLSDCLGFAEQNNLIPAKEIEQAKKVVAAMQKGVNMPGGCSSKESCTNYCTDLSHSTECLKVAQEIGILTPKEAEDTKKFVALAQSGQTPGGAKSKDECLKYCQGNLDECLSFAEKAGFLSTKEIELVKKTNGKGPGGCSSKGECEAYCGDSSNRDECFKYAKDNNINVSFNGPGGCSDEATCTQYCKEHTDNPECQKMAGQSGGFQGPGGCSDKDSCSAYCKSNPSDPECQKMMEKYGGSMPKGPGGCTDVASCTSYCKSNPKDSECAKYAGQYGGGSEDQGQQQNQDQEQNQQSSQQVQP